MRRSFVVYIALRDAYTPVFDIMGCELCCQEIGGLTMMRNSVEEEEVKVTAMVAVTRDAVEEAKATAMVAVTRVAVEEAKVTVMVAVTRDAVEEAKATVMMAVTRVAVEEAKATGMVAVTRVAVEEAKATVMVAVTRDAVEEAKATVMVVEPSVAGVPERSMGVAEATLVAKVAVERVMVVARVESIEAFLVEGANPSTSSFLTVQAKSGVVRCVQHFTYAHRTDMGCRAAHPVKCTAE